MAAVVFISGCASPPQTPVSWQGSTPGAKPARVGVVMTAVPKPDTYFPGAACLLCMATASVANSALTDQVRTWSAKDLDSLRDDLAARLRERGLEPVVIKDGLDLGKLPDRGGKEPNMARKDFSALRTQHKIDKLLVVQIDALGATRNYAAYVPTGDPRAMLNGAGYIVNLDSQALEWFLPLALSVPAADGKWDEPPKYPGLTNAFFQVLEMSMDQLKQPFAK
jgi:hypothetical protein